MNRVRHHASHRAVPALSTAALVLAGTAALGAPAVAAPDVAARASSTTYLAAAVSYDGSSAEKAAASCWEIKTNNPDATDGRYWLVTPKLIAPAQFYCDMTTDGGGWVLIGRGRESWRDEYEGRGTTAEVGVNVNGTAAFDAKQLSSAVVDGLLNGTRPDSLQDGVRIRRARDAAGTAWQEVRFKFSSRDRWAWSLAARHPINSMTFDGVAGATGNSQSFGTNDAYDRVDTQFLQAQTWTGGLSYGSTVRGTPSASSYLWSATSTTGFARPFAQVFLRPKLMTSDVVYPTMTSTGLAGITQSPLAQSQAQRTVWGATGLAVGATSEMRTEVQAFAQIGDTVFAGGNFKQLQRDAAGSDRVDQSFLAAFDVTTGELIRTFRPTFNDQIKALVALPSGKLAVGGEFTTVNGVAQPGVAVLDPATGELVSSFKIKVENRLTGGLVSVRSLKSAGNYLYVGGSFTHLTGGSSSAAAYLRSGARVNATTGAPDTTWNPNFNGTVTEITPSADGARVLASGYFTTSNGKTTTNAAALNSAAGAAIIPWSPFFNWPKASFQFTVKDSPEWVWLGGSQHAFHRYVSSSLAWSYGHIAMQGGDFQTSVVGANNVYGGCHCDGYVFSGVRLWMWPDTFAQGDTLGFIGAWDKTTGLLRPEFNPILSARGGYGAWGSFEDSRGVLWVGGSFDGSVNTSHAEQYTAGFVRYAPRDSVAPAVPTNLAAAATGDAVKLTWSPIAESGVTYEILTEGRVVATSTSSTVTVPMPTGTTAYYVRAADAAGNRSATTDALTFDPASTPVELPVVSSASTWSWKYDATALPANWATPLFDASAWSTGPAPLGFGSSTTLKTKIWTGTVTSLRQLSAQFRTTFDVTDVSKVTELRVSLVADDGVVVYLNGTEVGRKNLPTGTLTPTTYATAAPTTAAATATPLTLTIPASALVNGPNVIAVETHLNYRGTADASMSLTAATYGTK